MLHFPFYLRRTTVFIRAVKCCFTFCSNQFSTALRAIFDKFYFLIHWVAFCYIDTGNFGNYFTSFFNKNCIIQMQIEIFNNICIMQ